MTLRVGCMEQRVGGGRAVVAARPTSHGHPLGEDGDGAAFEINAPCKKQSSEMEE